MCLIVAVACGGDDDAAIDAAVADAAVADAAAVDAPPTIDGSPFDGPPAIDAGAPDAFDPCPGPPITFTGDYVDWDSTDEAFMGIFDATFTDLNDLGNTAMTAPNGRVVLCVPLMAEIEVAATHPQYSTMVVSTNAAIVQAGPFNAPGLTPARSDSLFADELSLTRDDAAAQVIVDVRIDGEPAVGAQVSIGNSHDGVFTANASGTMVPGGTLTDGSLALFANAEIGAGLTTVGVVPPEGYVCPQRSPIVVRAGEVAFTWVQCVAN